jgi:uncharacterized protein (DUF952 family)|tara:strand:+ start:5112 stop:5681 length:570 start_codon:yes stop_codon:yes gene_type:complete
VLSSDDYRFARRLHKSKEKTMIKETVLRLILAFAVAISPVISAASESNEMMTPEHPYVFHLIQAELWQATLAEEDGVYYPPTYDVDGFTHGTANPEKLLVVANHFYPEVQGDWLCLRMTVESLRESGVATIFEGTAPVGDKPADFEGSDGELYPHILGGISPSAVLATHNVVRTADGQFVAIAGVTDSP